MARKTSNLQLNKFDAADYINYDLFNANWDILDKVAGCDYVTEKRIQKAAGAWSYVCFQKSGLMIQWLVDWKTGKDKENFGKWGTNKDALHCTRQLQLPSYARAFAQEPWSQVTFSGSGSTKWCCMMAVKPSSATRSRPPVFQLIDAYNTNKYIDKPTFSCLAVGFWK